jgi:release factor glutamine methyltransferase
MITDSADTVATLLAACRPRLARIGSSHEARWIVDDVMRRLKAAPATGVNPQNLLEDVLRRREAAEPLAYILGSWAFRSHEFLVGPGALIPRPETEELVEHVLRQILGYAQASRAQRASNAEGGVYHGGAATESESSLRIADLGAGTGCIGLSLALEMPSSIPAAEVHLVERSPQAWSWLQKNAAFARPLLRPGVSVEMHHGDWQQAPLPPLDFIVSNPPYVAPEEYANLDPSVKDFEPRAALVPERPGIEDPEAQIAYREIFQLAADRLRPEGEVWFELGPAQVPWILEVAEQAGFRGGLLRDMAGHPRFFRAQRA